MEDNVIFSESLRHTLFRTIVYISHSGGRSIQSVRWICFCFCFFFSVFFFRFLFSSFEKWRWAQCHILFNIRQFCSHLPDQEDLKLNRITKKHENSSLFFYQEDVFVSRLEIIFSLRQHAFIVRSWKISVFWFQDSIATPSMVDAIKRFQLYNVKCKCIPFNIQHPTFN